MGGKANQMNYIYSALWVNIITQKRTYHFFNFKDLIRPLFLINQKSIYRFLLKKTAQRGTI